MRGHDRRSGNAESDAAWSTTIAFDRWAGGFAGTSAHTRAGRFSAARLHRARLRLATIERCPDSGYRRGPSGELTKSSPSSAQWACFRSGDAPSMRSTLLARNGVVGMRRMLSPTAECRRVAEPRKISRCFQRMGCCEKLISKKLLEQKQRDGKLQDRQRADGPCTDRHDSP